MPKKCSDGHRVIYFEKWRQGGLTENMRRRAQRHHPEVFAQQEQSASLRTELQFLNLSSKTNGQRRSVFNLRRR
jgi:hypothetical protein